jgi:hypothetical protein
MRFLKNFMPQTLYMLLNFQFFFEIWSFKLLKGLSHEILKKNQAFDPLNCSFCNKSKRNKTKKASIIGEKIEAKQNVHAY